MEPFGPNIIILDDAWEAMATSPARPMLVSVRETHEETEKRGSNLDRLGSATKVDCLYYAATVNINTTGTAHEWKEWCKNVGIIVGCVVGFFVLFISLLFWLASDSE
jgi:hypothetical protein